VKSAELFKVKDDVVVVTGGASGLGLGFAEALASNGARVTLLDLHEERVKRETGRLSEAGYAVTGGVVDVSNHAALDAAIDEVVRTHGRLDTVFANAGIDSGPGFLGGWVGSERPRVAEGALESYADERWNRVLEVNLSGVFATVRAAARHMRPRRHGRIIITTSLAASRVETAVGSAYMAAKAGATHFMRTAALELAAYGITVNAIAPGFIVTNIGGGHAHNKDLQAAVARVIPMHRVGLPNDLHGLALFLASPASAYVTGQEIIIDGGWGLGQAD
jgi:NAD(P)-dependent dehydrogenase (short-subunit alcohol dehydrogenase family)